VWSAFRERGEFIEGNFWCLTQGAEAWSGGVFGARPKGDRYLRYLATSSPNFLYTPQLHTPLNSVAALHSKPY
jgi:hypothetical protein